MADYEHFVGNRSPSLTDVIRVDDVPFPLTTSTVKLKMRGEGLGTPLKIDAAAVVTDAPNGAVRYDWAANDVDTAGEYLAWWEVTLPSGKTQDTPEFSVAMIQHTGLGRALCELEDVTAYAPGYTNEPETDTTLNQMILAESFDIMRETGREMKAIFPAADPRRFDLGSYAVSSRYLRIGDAAAISAVSLYDIDNATLVTTLPSSAYVLEPKVRAEWEPIRGLYFPFSAAGAPTFLIGQVLQVTGTWGWPAIPADLREACARIVLFRYVQDAAAAGTTFAEALAGVNVGALYASGRATVERYVTPAIA